jgi:hypothetical protein
MEEGRQQQIIENALSLSNESISFCLQWVSKKLHFTGQTIQIFLDHTYLKNAKCTLSLYLSNALFGGCYFIGRGLDMHKDSIVIVGCNSATS